MGWAKVRSFGAGPPVYIDAEKYTSQSLLLGRWFPQVVGNTSVVTCINQGSEIRSQVRDTATATANFYLDPGSAYPYYIAYSVDGAAFTRVAISTTTGSGPISIPIATGMITSATHTVRIVAAGLYEHDQTWDSGVGLHFIGIGVAAGGRVMPWVSGYKRILFLGDSITAGINLLGTGATPNINAGEQNWCHICATQVGADPIQVGFGATGVTTGGSGNVPPSASSFPLFMTGRNLSELAPDVIVINLGTNDASASSSTFQTDYQNYVNLVQSTYPNVPIFCVCPFNQAQSAGVNAVATSTAGCTYVATSTWSVTTTDGTHPNQAGSQTAGTNMASELVNALGSGFFD